MKRQELIYQKICENPGIHFRELQRALDIATGSLEHHVRMLHKKGRINYERMGHKKRLFARSVLQGERRILGALREGRVRSILLLLLEAPRKHKDITASLGVSPSCCTWYLKRLIAQGLIVQNQKVFHVNNPEHIRRMLEQHKATLVDKIVDRFIHSWEQ